MLHVIHQLDHNQVYISSDKFRGVLQKPPFPFHGIATNHASGRLNLIGRDRAPMELLASTDITWLVGQCDIKFWPIEEQVAYFLEKDKYLDLFGDVPDEPSCMEFDLETYSEPGKGAEPVDRIILAIGYQGPKDPEPVLLHGTPEHEVEIIQQFLQAIIDQDPDITAGYFSSGTGFDIPTLLARMAFHNIQMPDAIHRTKPTQYDRSPVKEAHNFRRCDLSLGHGRVHYDIFSTVRLDTALPTKNRRMKTVGDYFGFPGLFDIEGDEKKNMLELYMQDRDKFLKYLFSDVGLTRFLRKIYYPQVAHMAMMTNSSLNAVINGMGRAPFARMFMARSFISRGIIPLYKNERRNDRLFSDSVARVKGIEKRGAYRGAYTAIKKTGFFQCVSKVDFSSLYPSIMVTFNISPDTVKYKGCRPLPENREGASYSMDAGVLKNGYWPIIITSDSNKEIEIEIPDELLQKYMRFAIRKSEKGVIPEQSKILFDLRKSLKDQMKLVPKDSSEYKVLDSRQLATKIANNATYGISGNPNIEVGDLGSAMLTTAFGRELAHFVASYLGDTVIEIDTDGLYFEGLQDIDAINAAIADAVKEKYKGFPFDAILKMEMEVTDWKGLFTGMKTYMLRDPRSGKMKVTGSAFKGSSKARYVDEIIRACAEMIFDGKDPIVIRTEISKLMRDPKWLSEDFKIHSTIKRELAEYKADGGLQHLIEAIDNMEEDVVYDAILTEAKARFRKEFDRLPEAAVNRAKVVFLEKGVTTPEQVIESYANGYREVLPGNPKEAVKMACIDTAVLIKGKVKSTTANIAYKLLVKAREDGIVLMPGESLDYYIAYSPDEREMFTNENLANYPINYAYYEKLVNSTIETMLSALGQKELATIF